MCFLYIMRQFYFNTKIKLNLNHINNRIMLRGPEYFEKWYHLGLLFFLTKKNITRDFFCPLPVIKKASSFAGLHYQIILILQIKLLTSSIVSIQY